MRPPHLLTSPPSSGRLKKKHRLHSVEDDISQYQQPQHHQQQEQEDKLSPTSRRILTSTVTPTADVHKHAPGVIGSSFTGDMSSSPSASSMGTASTAAETFGSHSTLNSTANHGTTASSSSSLLPQQTHSKLQRSFRNYGLLISLEGTDDNHNKTKKKLTFQFCPDHNFADIHPNAYAPAVMSGMHRLGGGGSGVAVFGGKHDRLGDVVMKHGSDKDLTELFALATVEQQLTQRGGTTCQKQIDAARHLGYRIPEFRMLYISPHHLGEKRKELWHRLRTIRKISNSMILLPIEEELSSSNSDNNSDKNSDDKESEINSSNGKEGEALKRAVAGQRENNSSINSGCNGTSSQFYFDPDSTGIGETFVDAEEDAPNGTSDGDDDPVAERMDCGHNENIFGNTTPNYNKKVLHSALRSPVSPSLHKKVTIFDQPEEIKLPPQLPPLKETTMMSSAATKPSNENKPTPQKKFIPEDITEQDDDDEFEAESNFLMLKRCSQKNLHAAAAGGECSAEDLPPGVEISKSGTVSGHRDIALYIDSNTKRCSVSLIGDTLQVHLPEGAFQYFENEDHAHTSMIQLEGDGHKHLEALYDDLHELMKDHRWKFTMGQKRIGGDNPQTGNLWLYNHKLKGRLLDFLIAQKIKLVQDLASLTRPEEQDPAVLSEIQKEVRSLQQQQQGNISGDTEQTLLKLEAGGVSDQTDSFVGNAIVKNFRSEAGRFPVLLRLGERFRYHCSQISQQQPTAVPPAPSPSSRRSSIGSAGGSLYNTSNRNLILLPEEEMPAHHLGRLTQSGAVLSDTFLDAPMEPIILEAMIQDSQYWQHLLELATQLTPEQQRRRPSKTSFATKRIWTCGLADAGLHNLFILQDRLWLFDLGEPELSSAPGFLTKVSTH